MVACCHDYVYIWLLVSFLNLRIYFQELNLTPARQRSSVPSMDWFTVYPEPEKAPFHTEFTHFLRLPAELQMKVFEAHFSKKFDIRFIRSHFTIEIKLEICAYMDSELYLLWTSPDIAAIANAALWSRVSDTVICHLFDSFNDANTWISTDMLTSSLARLRQNSRVTRLDIEGPECVDPAEYTTWPQLVNLKKIAHCVELERSMSTSIFTRTRHWN